MSPERKCIVEPSRSTPVRAEVDVLVVGGGLAGVSAAIAAAHTGARTLLIERNGFPGGVATAGLCCSVFNSFYNSRHELIVTGNALEITDELARVGGPGTRWHDHKGHIIYDVEAGKLALLGFLEAAGADYLVEALAVAAIVEDSRLRGVVIETKSGREAILAQTVVDATGDSDVAALAGAPVRTLGGTPGTHSVVFRIGNVDVDRFVQYFADHLDQYPDYMDVDWTVDEALRQYHDTGTFLFPHGGGMQMDIIKRGIASGEYPDTIGVHGCLAPLQMHALREYGTVHIITGFCDAPHMDVAAITRALTDGKRMAFAVTDYFRRYMPGFESARVTATADDLGMRVTRWIDGGFHFTHEMKETPARFPDAIGRGVVEHDFRKHAAADAWNVQAFDEGAFDIPYRCLLPREIEGLVMGAGRSISSDNPWLLRAMVLTMVVGQGAGAAAAVAATDGAVPREANIARVQDELRRQGVTLN